MPVDILVEIRKRLGRRRVIEVFLIETLERITQLAEDPESSFPTGIVGVSRVLGSLQSSLFIDGKSVTTSQSWRPEGLLRPLSTPTWTRAARALRVLTVDAGASDLSR